MVSNSDSIGGMAGAQVFIFSRQKGEILCNALRNVVVGKGHQELVG
jgi:hypothetical protein